MSMKVVIDAAAIAGELCARFEGCRGLRIGRSKVVHMIDRFTWEGGLIVPGPMCHQGNFGWSQFSFHPVKAGPNRENVCRKCAAVWMRRQNLVHLHLPPAPVRAVQPTLWVA